jgi:hypothetical protein
MNNIYNINIINDFLKSLNPDQIITINGLNKYYFYNKKITYEFHILDNSLDFLHFLEKNFDKKCVIDNKFQNINIFFKYILNIKFFKKRIRIMKYNKILN